MGEIVGEEGDGWGCLRCGRVVKNVRRWREVKEISNDGDVDAEINAKDVGGEENTEGNESKSEADVTLESGENEPEPSEDVEVDSNEEENLFS
jgi:hypothetical protein